MVEAINPEPLEEIKALEEELRAYDQSLLKRPRIIALSKADLISEQNLLKEKLRLIQEQGYQVLAISSITGKGLKELVSWLAKELKKQEPKELGAVKEK